MVLQRNLTHVTTSVAIGSSFTGIVGTTRADVTYGGAL